MAALYPPALAPAVQAIYAVLRRTEFETAAGDAVICLYEVVDDTADDEPVASVLAASVADIVMYVCQGLVEAAEPDSWRAGGQVGAMVWSGLLRQDDGGRIPELQFWIGESLAWWHEFHARDVVDAARPAPSASLPALDSLSLLGCEPAHSLRAVQAKATLGRPRWHCRQALIKFQRHQQGKYDDAWNDSLRVYRALLRERGIDLEVTAHYGPAGKRHFGISVVMAQRGGHDPVFDYSDLVSADARHGRALAMFLIPNFAQLVHDVAGVIRARLA